MAACIRVRSFHRNKTALVSWRPPALQQEGQGRLAGFLDLEGQQLVGSRPAQVHGGDWRQLFLAWW